MRGAPREALPRIGNSLPRVCTLAVCGLLACCSGLRDNFVALLPDENGLYGTVSFTDLNGKTIQISGPDQAVDISQQTASASTILPGEALRLEASLRVPEPIPPKTFEFLFQFDSAEMTRESKVRFQQAVAEIYREVDANIRTRRAALVLVEGYTDTAGDPQYNDRLSQQRADAILEELIKNGIQRMRIRAVGRGERDLKVQTARGVYEPRNRRAEITVL